VLAKIVHLTQPKDVTFDNFTIVAMHPHQLPPPLPKGMAIDAGNALRADFDELAPRRHTSSDEGHAVL
jgi:hypothetical protein